MPSGSTPDQFPSLDRRADDARGGVTPRVLLISLVALVLIAITAFYAELLYDAVSSFGSGVPASAPFAALFLLAAAATWAPLGRRFGFSRRELLATYIIVLAGAPLLSHGILAYMLPHSVYQQYAAASSQDYADAYLHLIPRWFGPTDFSAVESFFHGGAPVPWALWWIPLAAWGSFLIGIALSSCCLALLVQRQWITHERLSFPLAQIPLQLVGETDGEKARRARLSANRMLWLGFAVSFGIQFWNNLGNVLPALPAIPLGPKALMTPQSGPLAALGEFDLVLWPWLIAIAYLIPKDLSFSCWFFWVLRVGLAMIAIAAGAPPRSPESWLGDPTFPAFAFQGFGAILALSVWAVWRARKHLQRALRIALSRESGRADSEEPVPYRWALIGFTLSFAWLVYFCWLAGSRVIVGAGLIGLILAYYMMWTWLRAETGLGLLLFPLFIDDMIDALGNSIYRPREIVMIMSSRWTYFPGAGSDLLVVTGNVLEGLKVADSASIRTRPLVFAMGIGFMLSLAVGVYVTLTGIYHHGFYGLRAAGLGAGWLSSQVRWGTGHIFYALTEPSKLEINSILGIGAGVVVAITLGLLRLRFWWWPLHPVGYLAANSWGMQWFYMPFFGGWLAKTLVTRYGGLRLYRATVPLAVGLVAGDLINQVVWALYKIAVRGGA